MMDVAAWFGPPNSLYGLYLQGLAG